MQITRIKRQKSKKLFWLLGGMIILVSCNLPAAQSRSDIPISSPTPQQNSPTPTIRVPEAVSQETTSVETTPVEATPVEVTPDLPQPTSPPDDPGIPNAGTFPDSNNYTWQPVARFLFEPLDLAHSNDRTGKLYIVEKRGLIWQLEGDYLWPDPFLNIRHLTYSNGYETGLLGVAFHPNYVNNGYLFVHYSDLNENTVIARFQAEFDADQIDVGTQKIIYTTVQPYNNHNGGKIAFGPDGYLYIGLGDGGSAYDPKKNGQNTHTPLGAILRIDVDNGDPYSIPTDNPFVNGGGLPEVWAYGLRNPWRFSFDQLTGDLYIGDVGQESYEEIDFLPAGIVGGANFGWNYYEASHSFRGSPSAGLSVVMPIAEYGREGGNCTVIGGYVYRGDEMPEWNGIYFYGDYCSGTIWGLLQNTNGQWQSRQLYQGFTWVSSFGQDQEGNIYLLSFDGSVYRLTKE